MADVQSRRAFSPRLVGSLDRRGGRSPHLAIRFRPETLDYFSRVAAARGVPVARVIREIVEAAEALQKAVARSGV